MASFIGRKEPVFKENKTIRTYLDMDESKPLLSTQNSDGRKAIPDRYSEESGSDNSSPPSYRERKPFIRPSPLGRDRARNTTLHHSVMYNRYKYYSVLHADQTVPVIPDHVLPPELFLIVSKHADNSIGNQSSWVTIFSIWNTMMGTSLLSIPWAISQAGFTCALFMMIFIGGLSFYTTRQIVHFASRFSLKEKETIEFSDICRIYLGRWGDWTAFVFSLSAIFGALIVYFVLMSSFLYNTGHFIHERTHITNATTYGNNSVLCPSGGVSYVTTSHAGFYKYWDQEKTVPFFLIIVVFPLINIKSPTFFTKFNALGTISILYVIVFTVYKCAKWGINADFSGNARSQYEIHQFETTFPALSGTLTLAFFIHNCVLSITRYQRHPQHNNRDVFVAYVLVGLTYSLVGFLFYLTFPLHKSCIEEVLLQNFLPTDAMAFGVRFVLLFQMITVLPLLVYIIRVQIMNFVFNKPYPSFMHVLVLNVFLMIMCTLFARFYPHVGNIIRFTGAICGLAYVYTLPPIIHMLEKKESGELSRKSIIIHSCIVGVGILNFIGQIIITVLWVSPVLFGMVCLFTFGTPMDVMTHAYSCIRLAFKINREPYHSLLTQQGPGQLLLD